MGVCGCHGRFQRHAGGLPPFSGTWLDRAARALGRIAGRTESPGVLIIACSDSRVDPALIFDTNPGEIFVVRNVAALVPPFETTDRKSTRLNSSHQCEFRMPSYGWT